ncbi:prophage regulatory protein [Erwinia toletana]|uniref:Prophage regulatory protein n=2 Tax=Winslowiella toletana TaxID=92490 RepID=A0ABS4PDN6_9GAMM|nr:AlpA family transcriptional regulator [Winslowiella toletana]MBP2170751.1 prophage regulatory protein [Winslowiella toletana]
MDSFRLIRLPQVEEKTGFGKSWIYQQIRCKQFPTAIRIGTNSVAWLESDIDEWINRQISLSRNRPLR